MELRGGWGIVGGSGGGDHGDVIIQPEEIRRGNSEKLKRKATRFLAVQPLCTKLFPDIQRDSLRILLQLEVSISIPDAVQPLLYMLQSKCAINLMYTFTCNVTCFTNLYYYVRAFSLFAIILLFIQNVANKEKIEIISIFLILFTRSKRCGH